MSISTLASLGMALGAPLVYADQAYSIHRKQDARGFSHDVCAVLLIANITRCFFWLGERFEFALLLQSLLMIAAQLGLLYLCIRYRPVGRWSKSISSDGARVVFDGAAEEEEQQRQGGTSTERDLMDLNEAEARQAEEQEEEEGYANKQPLLVTLGAMFRGGNGGSSSYGRVSSTDHSSYNTSSGLPAPNTTTTTPTSRVKSILSQLIPSSTSRPLNFWQWSDYNSYLIFLFLYILLLLILYIPLSHSSTFISLLGYIALGLESTLPIPQLIANYRRKSLAGFRASVLFGWLGGDSFKLLYFLLKGSPAQFTTCAVFQLSVDLAILGQRWLYREKTQEEEEGMRSKAEGRSSRREGGRAGEIEEDGEDELPRRSARGAGDARGKGGKAKGKAVGKRKDVEEEDELLQGPQHVISIEADDDEDEGDISNGRRK
ncbi:Scramblase ANY1 [Pseudozyma hubeiensis]|nr:Scramblase ANY1 [Pseudozyma hubeiensis]